MANIRVHALAKEIGVSSKELLEKLDNLNIEVKNHFSTLTDVEEKKVRDSYNKKNQKNSPTNNKVKENKTNKKQNFNKKTEGNTIEAKDQKSSREPKKRFDPNKNRFNNRDTKDRKDNIDSGRNNKNTSQKNFKKDRNNKADYSENKFNNKRNDNNKDQNREKNHNFKTKERSFKDSNRENGDYKQDRKVKSRSFNKMSEVLTEKDAKKQEYSKKKSSKNKNYKNNKVDRFELQEEYKQRDLSKKAPKKKVKKQVKKEVEVEENVVIQVQAPLMVKDFAKALDVSVSTIITKLIGLGIMASQNESIDSDVCELLADDLGIEIEISAPGVEESIEESFELDFEDPEKSLKARPPVVTVMGHVDHGKTSILDAIKESHVTSTEAGGITQHIGAYTVTSKGKKITFLDTPGHEAFTAMRLRGAQITDVAILVVAADDGVMPQTIEAISHARSAHVPIIVAINKIDKESANIDRVKQELSEQNLIAEDWGGDTIMVPVSARTKEGIDDLLEMILLVAEMGELKANPNRMAIGTIIEAKLDKGKGPMATVLVQKGTLKANDFVVSGIASGRIRAMNDDKGKRIKKAGPSMPAVILGLSDVPNAGDLIYAVKDDKTAKTIADKNKEILRENKLNNANKVSLENLFDKIKEGEMKELDLIVKGDVKGSVEALCQSLLKISNDEVKISIVHSGVGGINESDITLASASNAIVIGFNVRPNINAIELAKAEEVDVRTYRVIYDIINDIEAAAKGMLEPEFVEEVQGRCQVRQTFKLPNNNIVAGVYVLSGKITRNSTIRVLRDDKVIFEGGISSLKRFKDDVKELQTGFEGGMVLDGFNDIKEEDSFEAFIMKEVERKWTIED